MKALELFRKIKIQTIMYCDSEIDEAIAELEALNATCYTCEYFDKESWGGECTNFGFKCLSDGNNSHIPDEGYRCNRYKNKGDA